jgi:hypothetical protein
MITRIATLIPASNGYAWQPADVSGLHRDDGTPSQPGDVLSVQPDGSFQTRPHDKIGSWEVLTLEGALFKYAGNGSVVVLVLPPGL